MEQMGPLTEAEPGMGFTAAAVDETFARGHRRQIMSVEVLARLVLLLLVPMVLPSVFFGDPRHYWRVAQEIHPARSPAFQWLPYRRVFWEYPPMTLPVLGLARLALGSFRLYRALLGSMMIGCEMGCLHLLRRAWPNRWNALTTAWNITVLPVAVLAWYRIDFVVVLFATMSLISISRRSRGGAGAIVAGFATKIWPIIFVVPLALRRRWRDVATAVGGCCAVVLGWIAWSPTGFSRFLAFRTADSMEPESLPGGFALLVRHNPIGFQSGTFVLLHEGGARTQQVLYVALFAVGAICYRRARGPSPDLVALCGALTVASMLCSWILSPQYLVWPAPFVAVLAARGHRRIAWWYGGATTLTFLYLCRFKAWYEVPGATHTTAVAGASIVARNVLLVVLLVELIFAIRGHSSPSGSADRAAELSSHDPSVPPVEHSKRAEGVPTTGGSDDRFEVEVNAARMDAVE
jgi:hypothetical protein